MSHSVQGGKYFPLNKALVELNIGQTKGYRIQAATYTSGIPQMLKSRQLQVLSESANEDSSSPG